MTKAERDYMGRRSVFEYEGLYEVSSDGRIYSIARLVRHPSGGNKQCHAKEIKAKTEANGYMRVSLSKNGVSKSLSVHRIVCRAFHGEPTYKKAHVNHKNGVKHDNKESNLEWMTASENAYHSFRVLGRVSVGNMTGKFGASHNRAIRVDAFDLITLRTVESFGSMQEAGRMGFNATNISACIKGRRASHKNLGWRISNGK